MSRVLAALVLLALVASAMPAGAMPPSCPRCCDSPRVEEAGGLLPPCCRLTPDSPRPLARIADARVDAQPARAVTAFEIPRSTGVPGDDRRSSTDGAPPRLRLVVLRI